MTNRSAPLLSVCIPTYNRSSFLDACLASVLPQVQAFPELVECVVSDNASTDETAKVINRYTEQYPLRTFRNQENLGAVVNVVRTATDKTTGDYVWVLGDDDTLCAKAVSIMVKFLQRDDPPDLIALNVGYLPEQDRPAANQVLGGTTSQPKYTLRKRGVDGIFPFEQLLEPPNCDFTAIYSFILRRDLWQKHFADRQLAVEFTSVETTYPHAMIVAKEMPGKAAGLIMSPLVMTYELPSSQLSWSRFVPLNVLRWQPELLHLFEQWGTASERLTPFFRHATSRAENLMADLMWDPKYAGGFLDGIAVAWSLRRQGPDIRRIFWAAMRDPRAPFPCRAIARILSQFKLFVWRLRGRPKSVSP